MSRHLFQLQHLFVKLRDRYGDSDHAVCELGAQLQALEVVEAKEKETRVDTRQLLAAGQFRANRSASSGAPRLL
ncbi:MULTISPECIES: hypothetical protein [unclassified Variovorax]|uniref:hypothetical protein n=1 Tax=unclassified Variovorax TaxID=663243 RepID=UPI0008BEA541|nr:MULTISPECIES: hypothetical protein [unclassified Variovorax]SEK14687.1 hypothetical protein SAMN05518853_11545 [Variovorax sp. OK202]SFE02188.1 hypothetical protein SAMN05444746_11545 [Variovorax sp. OK212]